MSAPEETYRATIQARTPDGDASVVIVTRQVRSKDRARVWLTLHGSWRGTVCFTDDQVDQLVALLRRAKRTER